VVNGNGIGAFDGASVSAAGASTWSTASDGSRLRRLTLVYDSGAATKSTFYKDATNVGTSSDGITGTPPAFTTVNLGRRVDAAATRYFAGEVYSAAIWARALAPSEVAWLDAEPFVMFRRQPSRARVLPLLR